VKFGNQSIGDGIISVLHVLFACIMAGWVLSRATITKDRVNNRTALKIFEYYFSISLRFCFRKAIGIVVPKCKKNVKWFCKDGVSSNLVIAEASVVKCVMP
jgi:hypothetical protein